MVMFSDVYSLVVPRSPEELIRLALEVASATGSTDLPVAAVITGANGSPLVCSKNSVTADGQVTAHAELMAIGSLDVATFKRDGKNMSIAVTLEPCPMCAWAIRSAGIGRLVFGAYNPQYGAAGSVYDLLRDGRHGRIVEVIGGVLEEECQQLLGDSFSDIRNNGSR